MEDGRWKMGGGRWKMEGGRWKVEGGRWEVGDGRWKVEDGRWKMENGKDMEFNKKNPTEVMCMEFAVNVVNLGKNIMKTKHEYKMSDQLMRAGTAIGASYGEAQFAESPADFIHKLRISLKESHEVLYWLEVLQRTDHITEIQCKNLYDDANKIQKVLTSIVNTRRRNAGL